MITEKKNQHYIPKFYLRNFSFHGNKKQLGVYNLFNKKYIQRSKLKTQGSKNFFYGHDGIIEDRLADIEGELASIIKNVVDNSTVPNKGTKGHIDLLAFVSLTDLRNPVRIDGMKNMFKEMERQILELDPNADVSKLIPQLEHEDHIQLSLANTAEIIQNTLDLDYKLLINQTTNPFITSDFPVVKYNQFLELKKWPQSKSGYGLVGLQIFIPLNHEIAIVFFDSAIYKVSNKKKKSLLLTQKDDVDKLNILQFINCFSTIFFDEKAPDHYIRFLHNESLKYERANKSQSELSFIIKEGEEKEDVLNSRKENLMILNSSDCEMNLNINGIKIHSKGKYYKLNSTMSQLRKHPENLRRKEEMVKKTANN
jgi:hypothetical protein